MADRGGEGNRPPRSTLGDYAYQQGPKHYNRIAIYPLTNKVVVLKPVLLSLIGSHPFPRMDHEDPYTHFLPSWSYAVPWELLTKMLKLSTLELSYSLG